jgi:hypothetical protein
MQLSSLEAARQVATISSLLRTVGCQMISTVSLTHIEQVEIFSK